MTRVQSHRDLFVWQKAMDLVEMVYQLSRSFPDDERFGLVSQVRRAAVSVPSNIAEGHGRGTRRDYAAFVAVARGSVHEIETQLLIAIRLDYIRKETAQPSLDLVNEIERMLATLRRKLVS